jgi:hypothetical protein
MPGSARPKGANRGEIRVEVVTCSFQKSISKRPYLNDNQGNMLKKI